MKLQFSTRPLQTLAAAAGLAIVALVPLLMGAAPAQAQFFGGAFASRFSWALPGYDDGPDDGSAFARRGLPPGAIVRALAQDGYRLMGPLAARGRVYLADVADGETGQRERLVIDAFSGDIIESYPLGRQFAPPGNITRVPRADAPDLRPQPQRNARLAPPEDAGDPLVLPGIGAAPHTLKPKPAVKAKAPVKPKAVIARRGPADPVKPIAPPAPGAPPKPLLPSAAQPSDPLALPAPAEAAKPAAPDPALAAAPPAAAIPATAPAPAPAAADAPVQPLDDATPPRKAGPPVNDIPAAPLE